MNGVDAYVKKRVPELNQANDADTPKVEEPAQDPVVPVPIPSPLKS